MKFLSSKSDIRELMDRVDGLEKREESIIKLLAHLSETQRSIINTLDK